MKKFLTIFAILLVFMSVFPLLNLAAQSGPDGNEPRTDAVEADQQSGEPQAQRRGLYADVSDEERQQKINAFKEQTQEQKCEVIKENISKRKNYYKPKLDNHVKVYETFVSNFEKLTEQLSKKGNDISELDIRVRDMKEMVTELNLTYDGLVVVFQEIEQIACGAVIEELKEKVEFAQFHVREIRFQFTNFNNYLDLEMRNLFENLKNS